MQNTTNFNYGGQTGGMPAFSGALNNPPPTGNGQYNGNNQYNPAAAPQPSYGQSYTPQTQAPTGNRLGNIFGGNQGQAQGAQGTLCAPVTPADSRYTNLANDLARLKGLAIDAEKAADLAQKGEQADAGQNLVGGFLGDTANTVLNVGTAAASHVLAARANTKIKETKELEQIVCHTLKQIPEFAGIVTRGKSHDRLGTHKAIFQVGTWLDTINDLLCGGGCFDATSWWLVHRIGTVEDGLRGLQANIQALESRLASPQQNGGYMNQGNAYTQGGGNGYTSTYY